MNVYTCLSSWKQPQKQICMFSLQNNGLCYDPRHRLLKKLQFSWDLLEQHFLNLQSIWQSQWVNILLLLSCHTLLDATHNGEARQNCWLIKLAEQHWTRICGEILLVLLSNEKTKPAENTNSHPISLTLNKGVKNHNCNLSVILDYSSSKSRTTILHSFNTLKPRTLIHS